MGACLSCLGGDDSGRRPSAFENPVSYAAAVVGAAAQGAAGVAQGGVPGPAGAPASQYEQTPPAKAPVQVIASARVIKVPDGDTVTVEYSGRTSRVRVFAIDCPETKQNYGREAGDLARSLLMGADVEVRVQTEDRYKRLVAEIVLPDGRDYGRIMLAEGAAWHYKAYDKRGELDAIEADARQAERGLWAYPRPQAPWDYRRRQREAGGR